MFKRKDKTPVEMVKEENDPKYSRRVFSSDHVMKREVTTYCVVVPVDSSQEEHDKQVAHLKRYISVSKDQAINDIKIMKTIEDDLVYYSVAAGTKMVGRGYNSLLFTDIVHIP